LSFPILALAKINVYGSDPIKFGDKAGRNEVKNSHGDAKTLRKKAFILLSTPPVSVAAGI
jgi:hypothetical protein